MTEKDGKLIFSASLGETANHNLYSLDPVTNTLVELRDKNACALTNAGLPP